MNILLSIKPKWARLIYEGKKVIEWRKRIPITGKTIPGITKVFLYESSPISKITGYFILAPYFYVFNANRNPNTINNAEKEGLEKGCVSLQDLKRYQGKSKQIFGLPIHEIKKVDYPICLETFKIKRPPQSWCYIKEND